MPCLKRTPCLMFLVLILFLFSCSLPGRTVKLHYLGHSSFFMDFGGQITVLCDYGKENAYLDWGWDSPIHDAGMPGPDILCYSHTHEDHFDPDRAAQYDAVRISGMIDTCIGVLEITAFPSSEKDISKYDNHSYLFTYHGIRILHLGDCQADIMMINDPAHAWNIEQRYPKGCDIVIMPIESTMQFIPKAIKMVELLEPKVLIPSHYWSLEYKKQFLKEIEHVYRKHNMLLTIENIEGAEFVYTQNNTEGGLLIADLTPSKRMNQK